MLKIGDFSKIGLVSIKTLRHYDELDLLKPAHIDPETGYRYYQLEQLTRLNEILALKGLGFTLTQVKSMLDDDLSLGSLQDMLQQKREQIQSEIEAQQQRLSWVEAKLSFIEREGKMPNAQPLIKAVPAMHVLSIREPAPAMDNWGGLIRQTFRALHNSGVTNIPNAFAVFHGDEYNHEMVDWELAFPIRSDEHTEIEVDDGRVLTSRQISAVNEMASIVHHGSYATLNQAYCTLAYWIKQNGYEIAGSGREVYLKIATKDGQPVGTDHITEIQFPVHIAS